MKNNPFNIIALLIVILVVGCDNTDYSNKAPFDNAAYLDVAYSKPAENVTFKKTITQQKKPFSAVLAYPADAEVQVDFKVEPNLVANYNAKNETNYSMLDAKHYHLHKPNTVIPVGKTISEADTIYFTGLDELDIDVTYLCPLTINTVSGVGLLDGSKTIYYLVRRSSAITVAANLKDNYLEIPSFLDEEKNSILKDLTACTMEALVYVDDFAYSGPHNTPGTSIISTIMGVEDYFLLRFGDADFPRAQLQLSGLGGKFPDIDKSKQLNTKTWYHVAVTYDLPTHILTIYVNGEPQSRTITYGGSAVTSMNICGTKNVAFQIGRSYEDEVRQLNGNVAEMRIWNVARTQEEIWKGMYEVEPQSEGLLTYWKFNEGHGNTITDQTGHGFDAIASAPLVWPDGIEIPQINREKR